ncbi:M4 family metallopeptidase [Alteromonas sp. 1_MG-2023]|uniref:M4 family metallopeptidase n=1 Tax=Alteromonas sp. 1_MG-2023 TaxID=3062669 RepID=UPI0026E3DCCF|nr:M4 family metallopeptidase [Alteromonas sp. 1_MG-2023]MDO6567365.1 M4 family metallopeptidase [Alteromonas sp. 1_MG-2023]
MKETNFSFRKCKITGALWLALLFFVQLEPVIAAEKIGGNRAPKPLDQQAELHSVSERKAWVKAALSAQFDLDEHNTLHVKDQEQLLNSFRVVSVFQTYNNVPVVYGESRLLLNEKNQPAYVLGKHGNISSIGTTEPRLSEADAFSRLQSAKEADVASRLVYWPSPEGHHVLAYEFEGEFKTKLGFAPSQRVFIDASTGEELDRVPLFHTAMHRQVNNFVAACNEFKVKFPLIPPLTDRVEARAMKMHARTEGSTPSNDASVETAFTLLGDAYEFIDSVLGMDSIDGNGLRLNMFINVHFLKGMPTIQCYGDVFNAMWMSRKQSLYVPQEGLNFIEITMHELAHGIVSNGSNLEYSFQSGALNESIADSIGVAFRIWLEHSNKKTNSIKIPREYWVLRMPSGPERDLADPSSLDFGQGSYPDHMDDFLNWPIKKDRGGVHINSSIMNMAFYLMANGGLHPRHSGTNKVTAIGLSSAVHIVAQAASKLLVQSSNFEDARFAYALAAEALHGKGSKEWVSVHQAMDAVGVSGAWSMPQEMPEIELEPEPEPEPKTTPIPKPEPTPTPEPEQKQTEAETVPAPPAPETTTETKTEKTPASSEKEHDNQLIVILVLGGVGLCIALLALFKLKPAYSKNEGPVGYGANLSTTRTSTTRASSTSASAHASRASSETAKETASGIANPASRQSEIQSPPSHSANIVSVSPTPPCYLQSLAGRQKLDIAVNTAAKGEGFVIGRALELVHLQLRDERISRRHLRIKLKGSSFTVEDLNSTHGTLLDGERLHAFTPAPITHGQLLRIADFSYVFKVN